MPEATSTPAFRSILFEDGFEPARDTPQPDCFVDLRLDQVVASVTLGRVQYELAPYFHVLLRTTDEVAYRQEVFHDLERPPLRTAIGEFATAMRLARELLGRGAKSSYPLERQRWHLDAAGAYRQAVERLSADLDVEEPASRGLRAWHAWLRAHLATAAYTAFRDEHEQVVADLDAIRYRLLVAGSRVTVSHLGNEPDYSEVITETFERFRQGDVADRRFDLASHSFLNHVEAEILARVARLHPAQFAALDAFSRAHASFIDPTVARFDREIQLYVAWLEHLERIRAAGIATCLPVVTAGPKELRARDVGDLALAARHADEGGRVVLNDAELTPPERVLVVTGPNQGGKTTFSRAIGQLHYLAALGFPVAAAEATVPLVDRVFTHFEREEDVAAEAGKLEDELLRIRAILAEATDRSLLVMNESFSSTTADDALLLNRAILGQVIERRMLGVAVTFLDELSTLGEATVSMVTQVDPADPAVRTFRVVRRPADGLAYAMALAEKHGLTSARLRERLAR